MRSTLGSSVEPDVVHRLAASCIYLYATLLRLFAFFDTRNIFARFSVPPSSKRSGDLDFRPSTSKSIV